MSDQTWTTRRRLLTVGGGSLAAMTALAGCEVPGGGGGEGGEGGEGGGEGGEGGEGGGEGGEGGEEGGDSLGGPPT